MATAETRQSVAALLGEAIGDAADDWRSRHHATSSTASLGAGASPMFALMVRSSYKFASDIYPTLACYCSMVPAHIGEVVIVLDDDAADRHAKQSILNMSRHLGAANVRVILEAHPPPLRSGRRLFVGHLEGPAGKDRSQWSNFWFDNYTRAPVIAMSDAEVCVHLPIVPPLFLRHAERCGSAWRGCGSHAGGAALHGNADDETHAAEIGASEHGMTDAASSTSSSAVLHNTALHNTALHNTVHLSGDAWGGVDSWALQQPMPVDVMYPGRFPIFVWRSDLPRIRAHLAARFQQEVGALLPAGRVTRGDDGASATASAATASARSAAEAFNEAFACITNAPRILTPYQRGSAKRWGFSQFNMMLNWAYSDAEAARRYVFHTPDPERLHLPAAFALPGANSTTGMPWVSIGFNHGTGFKENLLGCCAMFGSLAHGACPKLREEALSEKVAISMLEKLLIMDEYFTRCYEHGNQDGRCFGKYKLGCDSCEPVDVINEWPPINLTRASPPARVVPSTWATQWAVRTAAALLIRASRFVHSHVAADARARMLHSCKGIPY